MPADLVVAQSNSTPIVKPTRRGPQFLPIKALHRHDGYITFIVKDDEGVDRLARRFAIRADALDTWFPEFTADLTRNAFCSINGGYTLANRNTSAPYGRALHNTDSLKYLCACYCDIDYYDLKLEHFLYCPSSVNDLESPAKLLNGFTRHVDGDAGMADYSRKMLEPANKN